jgi:hypothetical protein
VGQVVLIDSELSGGAPDQAAIEMAGSGAMFVRNVRVDGYSLAIRRDNQPVAGTQHVSEWVSHPVNTLFANQETRSLNMPAPLPKDMMDRNLSVDGDDARAFTLRDEYGPEVLNRFAIDFIDRHKDQPTSSYTHIGDIYVRVTWLPIRPVSRASNPRVFA